MSTTLRSVGREHQIGRLHIAMNDPLVVHGLQRPGRITDQRRHAPGMVPRILVGRGQLRERCQMS